MFNGFVLVGPSADPAHIRGSPDAAEAMRRIAESSTAFISRGDGSGTDEREQQLWRLAGISPSRERLVIAGAGMGTTLRIASQTEAYTLTDRATFAQHAKDIELAVLFESGSELLNTYAVTFDARSRRTEDARRFADWLTDGEGRHIIEAYRIAGEPAFLLWPAGRPRESPDAMPR